MTLELRNVTKRVGVDMHIFDTTLTLAPKGFNILLGATNAGKTSLIKMMAGLDRPTSGEIRFNGENVTGVSTQKRNISLVHQFFVNYPSMNVFDNIASPLRVARESRKEIERRVHEAADILKLRPYLKRRPAELSGGQQQRTALARAIVKDSSLVLLDEPLANLDYKLREELRDQLPQLFADRGAIVVYATSEPSEALMLGGHTATVMDGRVTQFGETSGIYRTPRDVATAQVFSDPPINIASAQKRGNEILLGETRFAAQGPIAARPDGTYTLGIRPHFVTSTPAPNSAAVSGTVQVTELSGSESIAHFAMGDDVWVAQSQGVHAYNVGEKHDFHIDTTGCIFFDGHGALIV